MAGGSYWRYCAGSRILYGQTDRYSFFRGGGLGGRPRTPKDSPHWGRPSGARSGRRRGGVSSDRGSDTHYDQERRFEEVIDSEEEDDDDEQGVGLDGSFQSDELHFTGTDIGRRSRRRRKYQYSDVSESSDDEVESDGGRSGSMQIALRDKEEVLVQKALAESAVRKSSARPMSNFRSLNYRLSNGSDSKMMSILPHVPHQRAEIAGAVVASRRPRSPDRLALASEAAKLASPPMTTTARQEVDTVQPPGILVPGRDGVPVYHPLGYYPPNTGTEPHAQKSKGSKSNSRSTSSHILPSQPTSTSSHPPLWQKRKDDIPNSQRQSSTPPRSPRSILPPSPRRSKLDTSPTFLPLQ